MNTIIKNCKECNTEFECSKKEHQRGNGEFCSLSCVAKHTNKNRPVHNKICKHCGTHYESTNKSSKYCSALCKAKNYRARRNNGTRNERAMLETIRELPCVICGWQEAPRDVHHIIPVSQGGKNDPSNLVTLCPNHHRMAHYNFISEDSLRKAVESRTISSSSCEEQDAISYSD